MKRFPYITILSLIFCFNIFPQTIKENLKKHAAYLASDKLEGRKSGSQGNLEAAQYIADEFKKIGMEPFGDNKTYFQKFEIISELQIGKNNFLQLTSGKKKTSYKIEKDFQPLGFTLDTTVSGNIVFVGYGISAPEQQYDDYAGIDVKNKIVIALRGTPDGDNPHSLFGKFGALRYKAMQARLSGAAAIIVVTPTSDDSSDKLIKLKYDNSFSNSAIASINATRAIVNSWLFVKKINIDSLQSILEKTKKPNSFVVENLTLTVSTEIIEIRKTTQNIVGIIHSINSIPNQHIIIGAHYDHLGYGGDGSGSLEPSKNEIHNGADDNASGSSSIIEIARSLFAKKNLLKRDVLFIGFSGEEMGLLGSAYYTKAPLLPLEQSITMINLDMVGRLKDNKLSIQGTGTSTQWDSLLKTLNSDSTFILSLVKDGFGPSDHASFYSKNIPVLFFFTGVHEDYHKPSDDVEKLNIDGMEKIVAFATSVAMVIDTAIQNPDFQKTQTQTVSGGSGRGFKVTLGTVPDYSEGVVGFKLSDVRQNSPAEKGGLKGGDIIIKLGKYDIKSIYDYMYALEGFKPGEEAEVVYTRGTEKITSKVIFEKRN